MNQGPGQNSRSLVYIVDMKCNVTREYKLHELRQRRHAFAGRLLFKAHRIDIIVEYARNLHGIDYCLVETAKQVMVEDEDGEFKGDTLTYTESRWAQLHRPTPDYPFKLGEFQPFDVDNYELVEVSVTGGICGELDMNLTIKSSFSDRDTITLMGYFAEGLKHDALIAVFGSPHVKATRENIHQIPRVEEKADDLLNELAHKLKGGEYYGH